MDITAIKNQINLGFFDNIYIFTGEEVGVMDIYINKMSSKQGIETKRVDSIVDIFGKLKNTSFINKSYCYIIRDDKEFEQTEKLWQELPKVAGDNIIIFIYTNIDKRKAFYKHFKESIVEFNHMEPRILVKYVKKQIDLSEENCLKLIDLCECDYSRILLEIDKIKYYNASTPDVAFTELLQAGAIYQPPKDAIFDFVDSVLLRQRRKCFELYDNCKGVNESNIVLLSVLYNSFKQLLQVQSCNSKDICKSTGLQYWQVKKAQEKKGKYSTGELVFTLKLIQGVESGIKKGLIDEAISIDFVLTNIL